MKNHSTKYFLTCLMLSIAIVNATDDGRGNLPLIKQGKQEITENNNQNININEIDKLPSDILIKIISEAVDKSDLNTISNIFSVSRKFSEISQKLTIETKLSILDKIYDSKFSNKENLLKRILTMISTDEIKNVNDPGYGNTLAKAAIACKDDNEKKEQLFIASYKFGSILGITTYGNFLINKFIEGSKSDTSILNDTESLEVIIENNVMTAKIIEFYYSKDLIVAQEIYNKFYIKHSNSKQTSIYKASIDGLNRLLKSKGLIKINIRESN